MQKIFNIKYLFLNMNTLQKKIYIFIGNLMKSFDLILCTAFAVFTSRLNYNNILFILLVAEAAIIYVSYLTK